VLNKIIANPEFGEKINKNIYKYSDELVKHSKTIPENLNYKTNRELWKIIDTHVKKHSKLYEWGWLSNATDMFYPEYTNYLKNYLKTKTNDEQKINNWLVTLTFPEEKSVEAIQQQEFLELAKRIWKDESQRKLIKTKSESKVIAELKPETKRELEKFWKKYSVIGALYVAEPFSLEHYILELKRLFQQGNPAKKLNEFHEAFETQKHMKQKLLHELKIDKKHSKLFKVYADFMLTKFYRRYAQIRALYAMRRVFNEIARRFGITLKQARFLLTPEYKELLIEGKFNLTQLYERERFCVLYSEKNFDEIFLNGEARKLAKSAEEKQEVNVKELKGQCASVGSKPGLVRGVVKIILSPADMPKMKEGDILVAIATNPDVVPAMKKAAAIITDQGGVTCHAAIVSRELGIPCVIGTKIATKVFKDGDTVEVDAARGIVKKT